MKHPTTSFEISLKDLQNYTQNRLFYQSLLICFLVPEKRIIFAKVQRRKRGKIRLSYHLSFKLLVVNWSNMLHRDLHQHLLLSSKKLKELVFYYVLSLNQVAYLLQLLPICYLCRFQSCLFDIVIRILHLF